MSKFPLDWGLSPAATYVDSMRRWGALLIAAEAIVVVVLLPVTVNVATGGSAPPGFEGIRPVAWVVVATLGVIAVVIPLGRFLRESKAAESFSYSLFHRETQRARILARLAGHVNADLGKALEDLPWLPPTLVLVPDVVRPSADIVSAEP